MGRDRGEGKLGKEKTGVMTIGNGEKLRCGENMGAEIAGGVEENLGMGINQGVRKKSLR